MGDALSRRVGAALLAVGAMAAGGCGSSETPKPKAAAPAPAVEVATVRKATVPIETATIGAVEVSKSVAVRPRVAGPLVKLHFAAGQFVKAGDLLAEIDPLPYENALRRTNSILARDRATLATNQAQLRRLETLYRTRSASAEELDAARGMVDSLEATVAADEAEIRSAEMQLGYCKITAPLTGRTGDVLIDVGNLVDANQAAPLVVVHQLQPIDVSFSVPQQYLPAVALYSKAAPLTVAVQPPDAAAPIVGELFFWDNAVDPTTGT
ncbi:MAG: efflux RND transporter periplasmic adaptor subunit, partial [Planctomycetia bacterium]